MSQEGDLSQVSQHQGMNRRDFLKLTGVAGAAVALGPALGGVLAGCGAKQAAPSAQGQTKVSFVYGKAAGPVDHIAWALAAGEPSSLDQWTTLEESGYVAAQLVDNLMRLNPDYTITDGLAHPSYADPRTLVLDLKKGVRFWDGNEMTSADVKYSLDRARSPQAVTATVLASVDSVEASGPYQVKLHLKNPDELVVKELSTAAGCVCEKASVEKAGKDFGSPTGGIMGTGPFMLKKWTPGRSIELEANPNYWDPSWKPNSRNITITFFNDSTTLAQAMFAGEVDGTYSVPSDAVPRLSNSEGSGQLLLGPGTYCLNLWTCRSNGPLGDARVRQALFTSIDRPAIAKGVFHDSAVPVYTLVSPTVWDPEARTVWEQGYKPYQKAGVSWGTPAGIEAAKKLLASSTYEGEPIVMAIQAGDETSALSAQLIQQAAAEVGLKVEIRAMTAMQFFGAQTNEAARADLDVFLVFLPSAMVADPTEPLRLFFLPGGLQNYMGYNNPQVTQLLQQAITAFDPVARSQKLIQAQSIYENDWLYTALVESREICYLSKKLSGMVTSSIYLNSPVLATIGSAQ